MQIIEATSGKGSAAQEAAHRATVAEVMGQFHKDNDRRMTAMLGARALFLGFAGVRLIQHLIAPRSMTRLLVAAGEGSYYGAMLGIVDRVDKTWAAQNEQNMQTQMYSSQSSA
jgi:hypothetical protein